MSNRQVVLTAIILGLCASMVVWWLERYNRELLIQQFHEQIEKLPTYRKETDQ